MKNKFKVIDDVVEIELNNRSKEVYIARVSLKDFDIVNEIKGKWHCHYTKSGIYAKAVHSESNSKDKKVFMHRLITGSNNKGVVDHINRNTLDNRRINLRVVTHKENKLNSKMHKNNTSGITNVRFHTLSNKWQAYIRIDKKFKSLGLFGNKEEASKIVQEYKTKMAL